MTSEKITHLLDAWMVDRERGVSRTVAEMCSECPELKSELERCIQILTRFEQLGESINQQTQASQGEVDTSLPPHKESRSQSLNLTAIPTSIADFTPIDTLGEGGMGTVYLAEDRQLGRQVAVKLMKSNLAADPDARRRFLREARAMASIEHQNIMTIFAVGEDQGTPFLVMPVLKGETLANRLNREQRLSIIECHRISCEIAEGLAAAHAHGLIHRDIKPGNIWLEGRQGRVKILDFGLARPATEDQRVTQSGAVLGTPAYMAPEQAAGTDATPRSDLFSLGAVMYLMTTGIQPFSGPNMMATLNNLATRHPEPPHKFVPDVPLDFSVLIQQLLAKAPEQRLQSATEVLESLRQTGERLSASDPSTMATPASAKTVAVVQPATSIADQHFFRLGPPGKVRMLLAAGLAGFLLLLAGVIYRIQTDHGTVIVSIDDDQVEAKLSKDGLIIQDAKTRREWKLSPDSSRPMPSGEYSLNKPDGLLLFVTDDTGAEFKTDEFRIRRGDRITVRVTLETQVAAGPKAVAATDVTPDWKGWSDDAPVPATAPFDAAQARRHQEEWAKHLGVPVEYTNSVGIKFVLIPPGEFLMGATDAEIEEALKLAKVVDANNALDGEKCVRSGAPRHQVILTKPYYLGVYEVTQSQFREVMGTNPSQFSSTGRGNQAIGDLDTQRFPVDSISWDMANMFCGELNRIAKSTGGSFEEETSKAAGHSGFRLPTEAEWEFACRAGVVGLEPDTNSIGPLSGWYAPNSGSRPHPVGKLEPNAFGLFDMHGNVWEWVLDWMDFDFYSQSGDAPAVDPKAVVGKSGKRIFRGGSWSDAAPFCSAAHRGAFDPNARFGSFGFRVAISVDEARRLLTEVAAPSIVGTSDWQGWSNDAPVPAIAPFDAAQAKRHQEEWSKHLDVPVEYTNSIGMRFRLIPPGEFLMGSTAETVAEEMAFVNKSDSRWTECLQTETPQHRVRLSEPVYVAIHEITRKQFQTISNEPARHIAAEDEERPILWVSHVGAEDFCSRLSRREGIELSNSNASASPGYRLLTEAEWEFACRAGTATRFSSGSDESNLSEICWYRENTPGKTLPVGTLKANAFGIHDMLGNAWEWCRDEWSPTYYAQLSANTATDPTGPKLQRDAFVARGGDWHDSAAVCRVAFRYGYPATFSSSGMSFRVAVSWRVVRDLQHRQSDTQASP